jgi:type IV pilus biogenesis protein CpaD/CtpE
MTVLQGAINMAPIRSGLAIALAVLAAGCAADRTAPPPQLAGETVHYVYDVPAGRCHAASSGVEHFVAATANGRPESIRAWIEGPPGPCTAAIEHSIIRAGVDRFHIRHDVAAAMHHATRVHIERLLIGSVHCYLSDGFNRGIFAENASDPALGCSTAAALGSMVADPEDLHAGKGRSRAEGEPATSAVANMRGEQPTRAEQTGEDHRQTAAHPAQ